MNENTHTRTPLHVNYTSVYLNYLNVFNLPSGKMFIGAPVPLRTLGWGSISPSTCKDRFSSMSGNISFTDFFPGLYRFFGHVLQPKLKYVAKPSESN